ncbi:MAG: exodeoxyribonuclease V subunit gamma [Ignavibacteriales bacterium]|nr:exodeoxyribonuclease V subunit gamma [Ignavibacteriales bacterium]
MILSKNPIAQIDTDRIIQTAIEEGKLAEILCIVPTNRRALQLEMSILQASPSGAINPPFIDTLRTISFAMLQESGDTSEQITETAANLFLKQCMEENPDWRYFRHYKDIFPVGLVRILRQLYAEWKRHGITPESVLEQITADAPEYEQMKVSEIAALYKAFTEKIEATGRIETGDAYLKLLAAGKNFSQLFHTMYPSVKCIIVTGYSSFSDSEARLLSLFAGIDGIQFFIDIDYQANNTALFSHILGGITLLKNNGLSEVLSVKPEHPTLLKQVIRENLFTYKRNSYKAKFSDVLFLHKALSREDEVKQISSAIRQLVIKEGVNAGEIAVVFQLIQEYSPLIRSVFPSSGLRYNLTDRPVLSSSSAVNAVLHFLKLPESDFYYKDVFRAFSNSFVPKGKSSLADITRIAVKYRVIGGIKEWLTLDKRIQAEHDGNQVELEKIRACMATMRKARELLKPFTEKQAPDVFFRNFSNLIRNTFFPQQLTVENLPAQTESATALNALIQSVDELCELIKTEQGNAEPHSLAFYLDAVRASIGNTRFTLPPDIADSVLVTTPEEIRGMQFKHVFIGGLYDGNFPSRYVPDVFSPKTIARDEKQYLADQQYVFYEALLTGQVIHFSYPGTDDDKVLYMSHFLSAFMKQFDVTEIAPEKGITRITTKEELLLALGTKEGRDILGSAELAPEARLSKEEIEQEILMDAGRVHLDEVAAMYSGRRLMSALDDESKKRLAGFAEREYSITQLETYAACPFRFFLERVMGVEEIREPEEEAGRMEFGTLLHDILFTFVSELLAMEIVLAKAAPQVVAKATERLFAIALHAIEETDTGKALSAWDKELILGINGNRQASVLQKFVEYECSHALFEPLLLESAFGSLSQDAQASSGFALKGPVLVNNVKLRGKIDRIDINRELQLINVIDYKTGVKSYPEADLEAGLLLQLPVYLHAAKQITAAYNEEFADYSALFPIIYSLKYNEKKFGMKSVAGKLDKFNPGQVESLLTGSEAFIQTAINAITAYVENIAKGEFNLTKLQGNKRIQYACGYCDFLSVCRYNEIDSGSRGDDNTDETVNRQASRL